MASKVRTGIRQGTAEPDDTMAAEAMRSMASSALDDPDGLLLGAALVLLSARPCAARCNSSPRDLGVTQQRECFDRR
jgi:hypothetical protein